MTASIPACLLPAVSGNPWIDRIDGTAEAPPMPSTRTAFLVVACLIVVGCSTQAGVASGDRATGPAPQGGTTIAGGKDGITVAVNLGRDTVEPGGSVEMLVTVRNVRPTPATIGFGSCNVGATVYA